VAAYAERKGLGSDLVVLRRWAAAVLVPAPIQVRLLCAHGRTPLATVAETFAGVPDGRHTAHTLRLLAHFLDPTAGQ
jgi:hypothetical protein